jgi:hypothetical protein
MKRKTILIVILSLVAVIGCMVLNFQEFQKGSTANEKNLIVTFIYVATWLLVILLGSSSKKLLKYFYVFWITTLFISLVNLYINVTDVTASWALPLVILLMGQWYGLMYFTSKFMVATIVIAIISFGINLTILQLLRRLNKVN